MLRVRGARRILPAFALLIVSCGGGPWGPDPQIVITPEWAVLAPGESIEFTASIDGTFDKKVRSWTATGGTVGVIPGGSTAATYTAPVAPGRYEVTARSNAGGMTATATIVVPTTTHAAPCTDAAADVDIPDPDLAMFIQSAVGADDRQVTCADMQHLEEFAVNSSYIGDLEGIQHARELRVLRLDTRWLRFIGPLALTPGLTELSLRYSIISDLSPLAGLTNLHSLDLTFNQVADVSPVAGLTNLNSLDLSSNQVADVSPLEGLTNLHSLELRYNQVADVSPLAGLTNLEYLGIAFNQIGDMSPLAAHPHLEVLDITANPVTDLTPLTTVPNLKALYMPGVPATDMTPLLDIAGLVSLSLGWSGDSQEILSVVGSLTNLEEFELCCPDTTLDDLTPLTSLTSLKSLALNFSQLRDIDVLASLTGLSHLDLSGNYISDISAIEPLTNLTSLVLQTNAISDIGALVANLGLGAGDEIDLRVNCLDERPSSAAMQAVRALEQRGAVVLRDDQAFTCNTGTFARDG